MHFEKIYITALQVSYIRLVTRSELITCIII
nr:MAG TPA: hypothetical protein [Bacteriophage sp.]